MCVHTSVHRIFQLYGEISDVRKDYLEYILDGNAYVVITTSRNKRGELSGQLKENTLATVGEYILAFA